jgi:hypothetical protein
MNRHLAPDAVMLCNMLRAPADYAVLDAQQWTGVLSIARAEQLIGTLAHRLSGIELPPQIAAILAEARINADYQRRSALWEAECAARALAGYGGKVVLMKGTAYVAANLQAGEGRSIGDLDIMVAREDLPQVEAALLAAGWEWVKEDAYDDAYYRDHMHELPPLIHKERDRMIDVHHTILPLTARRRPDAGGMLQAASPLPLAGGAGGGGKAIAEPATSPQNAYPAATSIRAADASLAAAPASGRGTLAVLSPPDMVCHSAAHLFADGDLAGGLRNLWDIHCLLSEYDSPDFWPILAQRASHHQLTEPVKRAVRLAHELYGTAIPSDWKRRSAQDKWYIRRLTARDGWGRPTRKFTRLIFYVRSHMLRMPPLMLARHLFTKWRKAKAKT